MRPFIDESSWVLQVVIAQFVQADLRETGDGRRVKEVRAAYLRKMRAIQIDCHIQGEDGISTDLSRQGFLSFRNAADHRSVRQGCRVGNPVEPLQIRGPDQLPVLIDIAPGIHRLVSSGVNACNCGLAPDFSAVSQRKLLQGFGQSTGSAPGVAIIKVEAKIAQSERGGGLLEKVLGNDVQQSLIG